jgi:hypothetical protein
MLSKQALYIGVMPPGLFALVIFQIGSPTFTRGSLTMILLSVPPKKLGL